jgi:hypothetical protein
MGKWEADQYARRVMRFGFSKEPMQETKLNPQEC